MRFDFTALLSPARAVPHPHTPGAQTPCELKLSRARGRPGEGGPNLMDYDIWTCVVIHKDVRASCSVHRTPALSRLQAALLHAQAQGCNPPVPHPHTPGAQTPCELQLSRARGRPGEGGPNLMDYDIWTCVVIHKIFGLQARTCASTSRRF